MQMDPTKRSRSELPASRFEGLVEAQLILMQVTHGDAITHYQNAAKLIKEPVPIGMLNDGSWGFFLNLGLRPRRQKGPLTQEFSLKKCTGVWEKKRSEKKTHASQQGLFDRHCLASQLGAALAMEWPPLYDVILFVCFQLQCVVHVFLLDHMAASNVAFVF